MFKSYLKVGIRNLLNHKSYSFINITGLAAGICCCLFIVLYIHDELSYDRHHEKADRIYRISMENWAKLPPAIAPAMMASYPHLTENVVRLWPLFAPLPVFYTYVLALEGVSSEGLKRASQELMTTHEAGGQASPLIQPVTRIHLHSNLEGEFGPGGNVAYLFTLGTAALIVLLLACINFTNLTTARAATRTKEVGMRKVMGAMRRQLVGQFFGEALLMTVAAFMIAIVLVNLLMPAFNQISGKAVHVNDLTNPVLASGIFVLMLLIGLVAGGYPALYLSRFRPITVLKGSGNLRVSNLLIRRGLIVFQFTVSTVFMVGMAVVLLQLSGNLGGIRRRRLENLFQCPFRPSREEKKYGEWERSSGW